MSKQTLFMKNIQHSVNKTTIKCFCKASQSLIKLLGFYVFFLTNKLVSKRDYNK